MIKIPTCMAYNEPSSLSRWQLHTSLIQEMLWAQVGGRSSPHVGFRMVAVDPGFVEVEYLVSSFSVSMIE